MARPRGKTKARVKPRERYFFDDIKELEDLEPEDGNFHNPYAPRRRRKGIPESQTYDPKEPIPPLTDADFHDPKQMWRDYYRTYDPKAHAEEYDYYQTSRTMGRPAGPGEELSRGKREKWAYSKLPNCFYPLRPARPGSIEPRHEAMLASRDPEMRIRALHALEVRESPQVLERLLQLLTDDPRFEVRAKAGISALHLLKAAPTLKRRAYEVRGNILEAIRNDPSAFLRVHLLEALAYRFPLAEHPEVTHELCLALPQQGKSYVRGRMLHLLAKSGDTDIVPRTIMPHLKDPNGLTRKAAAIAMRQLGTPQAFGAALELMGDKTAIVRERGSTMAFESLGDLWEIPPSQKSKKVQIAIAKMATEGEHEDARYAAAKMLEMTWYEKPKLAGQVPKPVHSAVEAFLRKYREENGIGGTAYGAINDLWNRMRKRPPGAFRDWKARRAAGKKNG